MHSHEPATAPQIIWDVDGEWVAVLVEDAGNREAALLLVERWLEADDLPASQEEQVVIGIDERADLHARLSRGRQDVLARTTRLMLVVKEDSETGNAGNVTKECWVVPLIP